MKYSSILNRLIVIAAIASAGVVAVYATGNVPPAEAAVSNWQKGVSMYPMSSNDFGSASFDQSLSNAHSAGANTVVLIIPYYQSDDQSSDIGPGWNTPTDSAIVSAANYAHSLGMQVVLKPHVDPYNGDWRANINASNRDAWYGAYGYYLNHLGDLASQTGSQGMVVGTELISMADYTVNSDNTERWQTLISNLRQHFSGYLTYSANWGGSDYTEEAPHIGFWGSLDYIGISAYYALATDQSNPTVQQLMNDWGYWDTLKIQALHNQFGKPIIFTEIGYRSTDDAHTRPWYSGPDGGYNGTEQADDYQALFQYWNNQSYMDGVYLWNWDTDPNYGGQGNTDYTPANKPAQTTMTSWFGSGNDGNTGDSSGGNGGDGGSTGGAGNSPSSVSGNFSMSANVPTLSPSQNASLGVIVGVSGQATNVVVDAEIYDSSQHQVFQQFFTGQNMSSSQSQTYNLSWTPPSNGSYILKTGVFNSDWTHMYTWNDSVSTLNVGVSGGGGAGGNGGNTGGDGNNGGANPGPVVMDIWWPGDGSTVSGVQPFKGLVEGKALSDYTMYWQVDGGSLVPMSDSQADYPHKEFDVDVSPWNWKGDSGSGPYTITFVAKDSGGNIIAQKSVSISVAHW